LSGIGIGAYRGSAGFSVESSGLTDGSFSAAGNVGLSNNVIRDPEGTIAGAVADAVSRAGSIDLGIIYNHPAEGSDSFTVNTNIGNLIMDALSRVARAYAQKAVEELEKTLRGYINSYIQGKIAPEELDDLFALAKGDKAALDRLQANLQGRLADVEARVRGRVDGVIDDAKQRAAELEAEARQKAADAEAEARRKAEAAEAEVRRQAEDARKQAEAAQAEALRRAEETRRQAEEEARRRAEAAEAEIRRQAEEARKQAEEEARRQAQDALRGRLPF
jgi:flagellar biosynthesis GTPase FlhF